MVMADYSEFNNNNYLPGVYNDIETAFNYHSAMAHTRGPGVTQNGFTFTTPTQCNTLATHRPCIQTTSPIGGLSAPGVGASWQHSIPVTMPWVDMKSLVSHPGTGTTTVFTGTPASPHLEGQLSCSVPLRRPKRKALDLPDEAPISKIYLCADQFANMKISPCEKQNYGLPADDGGNTGVQFYMGASTMKSKGDIEGWQRFRDVENRLDVEVDEDVDLNMGSVENFKEGPCLKVAEGILDTAVTKPPILPRRVMEDITKPCLQIVLWKCPGEIIREVSKEESKTSASVNTLSTSTTSVATSSKNSGTSTMDVFERYSLASRDNFMDTCLDTPMLDSNSKSHFQPMPLVNPGSFSVTDFQTPSLLSNIAPLPSSSLNNFTAANCSSSALVDLDMLDNLDDEMQL